MLHTETLSYWLQSRQHVTMLAKLNKETMYPIWKAFMMSKTRDTYLYNSPKKGCNQTQVLEPSLEAVHQVKCENCAFKMQQCAGWQKPKDKIIKESDEQKPMPPKIAKSGQWHLFSGISGSCNPVACRLHHSCHLCPKDTHWTLWLHPALPWRSHSPQPSAPAIDMIIWIFVVLCDRDRQFETGLSF